MNYWWRCFEAINKAIDLSEKNIKDWLLESSSELSVGANIGMIFIDGCGARI
jgi:hypothetical protein